MKSNFLNKIISIIVVVVMVLSCMPLTFAEDPIPETDDFTNLDKTFTYENIEYGNYVPPLNEDRTVAIQSDAEAEGYIIYDTERCISAVITTGLNSGSPPLFYGSNDLSDWSVLTPSETVAGSVATWQITDYTVTLDGSYNYLKIVLSGGAQKVRLAKVVLNRLPFDYNEIEASFSALIAEKKWVEARELVSTVEDSTKKAELRAEIETAFKAELESIISVIENTSLEADVTAEYEAYAENMSIANLILNTLDITAFKIRVSNAAVLRKEWDKAVEVIEDIENTEDKNAQSAVVKEAYVLSLEGAVSALEAGGGELSVLIKELNKEKSYMDKLLRGDSRLVGFKERINALDEALRDERIELFKFEESFNATQGTHLTSLGWYADKDFNTALGSEYTLSASGVFEKSGAVQMFKAFASPMENSETRDYYISFEFLPLADGFTGLKIKDSEMYFGVKKEGGKIYPVLNLKEEITGEALEESEGYKAVLKIAGSKGYFSVYPAEGHPGKMWDISSDVKIDVYEEPYTEMDDYSSGNWTKAPNALDSYNVREATSSHLYMGDNTRLCRQDGTRDDGWVTYKAEDCESIAVRAARVSDMTTEPAFYGSVDGETWTLLTPDSAVFHEQVASGYLMYDYIVSLGRQYNYVKIVIVNDPALDGDANGVHNIQINHTKFNRVKRLPVERTEIGSIEVFSDGGMKLLNIRQEENYSEYTKAYEEAAEKMYMSKKLEDIMASETAAKALSDSIYKDYALKQVSGMIEKNKNTTPILDKVAIVGKAEVGSILSAQLTYTDIAGNFGESDVKWYVGDDYSASGSNFSVDSYCAGKTVRAVASIKNIFGVKSEEKTAEVSIRKRDTPSYSGGGGMGGGGGGGTSYKAPVNTQPVISEEKENISLEGKLSFSDIKDHWAKKQIEELSALGIINGMGEGIFAPEENVTRAQFAAFIQRALKDIVPMNEGENFTDVPAGAWYNEAVCYVSSLKIMSGDGEGHFYPERLITREEMAKTIAATYILAEGENSLAELSFSDTEDISEWAREAVGLCVYTGIMGGLPDGSFKPVANTTRAEAAVVLIRLLSLITK